MRYYDSAKHKKITDDESCQLAVSTFGFCMDDVSSHVNSVTETKWIIMLNRH